MYIPSMGPLGFRRNRVALHFCDVTLTAKKPISEAYPKNLQTIGDHCRKKRLDLKLFQNEVAHILGVDTMTICNWENNRGPAINMIPKIIQFLGYDPINKQFNTFGEKICPSSEPFGHIPT